MARKKIREFFATAAEYVFAVLDVIASSPGRSAEDMSPAEYGLALVLNTAAIAIGLAIVLLTMLAGIVILVWLVVHFPRTMLAVAGVFAFTFGLGLLRKHF